MEVKFCVDCRHCIIKKEIPGRMQFSIANGNYCREQKTEYYCGHPDVFRPDHNRYLVTGETHMLLCEDSREVEGAPHRVRCGRRGKLWEAKGDPPERVRGAYGPQYQEPGGEPDGR